MLLKPCLLTIALLTLTIWQQLAANPKVPSTIQQLNSLSIKLYKIPSHTPVNSQLYLAGSFNDWNPADPLYRLQKDEFGIYSISILISPADSAIAFKVTRGSWASVERDENNLDIGNHELIVNQPATFKAIRIEAWADLPRHESSTIAGHVTIIRDQDLPALKLKRDIWVYLPPNYNQSIQSYPVLYMYDAQNLFNREAAAFGQEWRVDESLEELFYEKQSMGVIVVAIANSTRRGCEYNVFALDPHPFCPEGPALGDAFNDFLAKDLKPWVDAHYRTLSDRDHTSVMGSSMGGQMALSLGLRYPEIFSKVFALSPSYQNSQKAPLLMPDFIRQKPKTKELAIYQDIGDQESIRELKAADLIRNMNQVHQALIDAGYDKPLLEAKTIPQALHNEKAWASRFKELAMRL